MARPIQITPTLSGKDSKNFNTIISSPRNRRAVSKKRTSQMVALYRLIMKKAAI